jgi:MFS family permease
LDQAIASSFASFLTAGQRRAAMATVIAGTSFNAVTADAMVSAMPQMSREFGSGDGARFLVQMIMVAPSISIIVGAPLAGMVIRRFGLKALMVPGLIIYALCGAFGYFAPDAASLILSRVILGFTSGLLGAAALTPAAGFPPGQQARLLGFANAMAAATAIGSFVLGGWLAGQFGWRTANLAYLWSLVLIPIVMAGPAQMAVKSHDIADAPFPWAATLPIYLLALAMFMIVYAPSIEGPFLLARRGMTDPSHIGLAISAPALACVLSALCYGRIANLLDRRWQYLLLFTLFTLSGTVTTFSAGLTATIIGMSFSGLASGMLSPLLLSTLMREVPHKHLATAAGTFASATFLSVFLTPPTYRLWTGTTSLHVYQGIALFAGLGLLVALARAGSRRPEGSGSTRSL